MKIGLGYESLFELNHGIEKLNKIGVKYLISTKFIVVIASIILVAGGSAGYAVATGAIYLGPSVPDFNVTGNGTTDIGVPVFLTVKLDSSPSSTPYYLWYANGKTGTAQHFNVTFGKSGIYNISLKISMSNNHTERTKIFKEIVNSDPVVAISENKNVIDAGQNISFSSIVKGGTAPYSYCWTFPGSSSPDPTMQLYSDFGGVSVVVVDAVGYAVTSNVLNPTVNSDPLVIAESNTSETDVGSPVSFSASSSYGTTPYSYSWTWDGKVISTSASFAYTFNQAGQQYVYCNLTDKVGMTSSDYVIITVEEDPTVSISTTQQNAPAGSFIGFEANINNGVYPFSFVWYVDEVNEGGSQFLYYTFNNAGSYNIEVVATDNAGKSSTAYFTENIT